MAKTYTQRNIGFHNRTPTDAKMRVTFENGEVWDFPAQIVADSRDISYADEKEDTIGSIRAGKLDNGDLTEWAINNMDWSDVKDYAVRVEVSPPVFNYNSGWMSADREVQGKV